MVFKKKTNRGKEATGRTPGEHQTLKPEEISKYNRETKRRSRSSSKTSPETAITSNPTVLISTFPKRTKGRPSLGDNAMTHGTLRKRKRKLAAEKRHQEKIRNVRSAAAKKNWSKRLSYDLDDDEHNEECEESNGIELAEVEGGVQSYGEDESEENQPHNDDSNNSSHLSIRQICRMKCRMSSFLPAHVLDSTHLF